MASKLGCKERRGRKRGSHEHIFAAALLRRALIVLGVMLAVGLGLYATLAAARIRAAETVLT